jgi:hypothetical protein
MFLNSARLFFPLRSYSSQLAISHNGLAQAAVLAVMRCTQSFTGGIVACACCALLSAAI